MLNVKRNGEANTFLDNPEGYEQEDFIPYSTAKTMYGPKRMGEAVQEIFECKTEADLQQLIDKWNEW